MRLSQISLAVTRLGGQDVDSALRKALWPTGTEPGLWINPSYTSASRQNSAGTTPLSTIGTVADSANPVGLIADQHFGTVAEVYGPEKVYNGNFDFDVGWGKGAGVTISSGRANFAASNGFLGQNISSVVVGDLYKLTFSLAAVSGGSVVSSLNGNTSSAYVTDGTYTRYIVGSATFSPLLFTGTAFTGYIDNVSLVRAAKGTHLSQATSTARPLASARVNLLTKTEDFSDAIWSKENGTTPTAYFFKEDATNSYHRLAYGALSQVIGKPYSIFVDASYAGRYLVINAAATIGGSAVFDLQNGTLVETSGSGATIINKGGGIYRCTISGVGIATGQIYIGCSEVSSADGAYAGDNTSGVNLFKAQFSEGPTIQPYQRVNTDSDYAAGSLIYSKLDGVDDGWVSETVAAGVIGNSNMELLMAVRIDETPVDDGIISQIGGPNYAWATGGVGTPSSGVGTPTYYVNNVGVAATRAAIDAAIGVGKWAILEIRGLDLSAWTNIAIQGWSPYFLAMGLGGKGIMLFPATDAATRNKARTALAASVGLVL